MPFFEEATAQTHNDLFLRVGRIEATVVSLDKKIDSLLVTLASNDTRAAKEHDEYDDRLTSLERDRAKIIGGALVVSALFSLLVANFKDLKNWIFKI